jgi:hypothetical protein
MSHANQELRRGVKKPTISYSVSPPLQGFNNAYPPFPTAEAMGY